MIIIISRHDNNDGNNNIVLTKVPKPHLGFGTFDEYIFMVL